MPADRIFLSKNIENNLKPKNCKNRLFMVFYRKTTIQEELAWTS